ncbi:MAG: hypothetical protein RLZZ232_518 [Planctomycetota bacterium]
MVVTGAEELRPPDGFAGGRFSIPPENVLRAFAVCEAKRVAARGDSPGEACGEDSGAILARGIRRG